MSSSIATDLETAVHVDQSRAANLGDLIGHRNMDWVKVMVAFCFSSAVDIAILSFQVHTHLPPLFFLVSLAILFAFTSFFVSKFVGSKFPRTAMVLERAGVFFVVTGFFIAITIPFPLCLRVVTWVVYAISFVFVIFCNYFCG